MENLNNIDNPLLDYIDEDPAPSTFNYINKPNKEKYLVKENIIPDDDDKK